VIRFLGILAFGFSLALSASIAEAHRLVASVYSAGNVIEGEVGFSNGDMAVDAVVEVFDAAGTKLGEANTNEEGFFVFEPSEAIEHIFRSNLGAGHVVSVTMPVDELPISIRPKTSQTGLSKAGSGMPRSTSGAIIISEEIGELISEAVRNEVRPLRKELAAYKTKNDFQSIIGGIGYIFGLFGLGFYLAARRQLKGDDNAN
jgi:nickel transport protein